MRPIHRIEAFPPRRSEALTAVGALTRQFLGASPLDPEVARGMALCARRLPAWERDGSIDMTYWYFGTLAAFRAGGDVWNRWDDALETAVRDTQRLDGDDPCGLKGSWDPQDPWGPEGGRVYATALLAMCLEVHYRYDRVFGIGPR